MKKISYIALAALAAVACVKEADNAAPEVVKGTPITIRAYVAPETKTAYEGGCHVDLKGDFVIMFEAVSFTQSSSNKDRVAIWDIEWTPNE